MKKSRKSCLLQCFGHLRRQPGWGEQRILIPKNVTKKQEKNKKSTICIHDLQPWPARNAKTTGNSDGKPAFCMRNLQLLNENLQAAANALHHQAGTYG